MTTFKTEDGNVAVSLVYIPPRLFLRLPPGQIQAACEEVELRLLHLDPVIILKNGKNPDEIQSVVDDVFKVSGNA